MKQNAKKIRNDIILILCLIFLGAILLAASRIFGAERADTVVISAGDAGEEIRLPLSKDAEYRIGGETDYNILIIKDGKAYISRADCPDGLCVKQGKISAVGQSIICLPHKTVIYLEDGSDK